MEHFGSRPALKSAVDTVCGEKEMAQQLTFGEGSLEDVTLSHH